MESSVTQINSMGITSIYIYIYGYVVTNKKGKEAKMLIGPLDIWVELNKVD